MKRFTASIALLAIIVVAGCEKLDSPLSPSQDPQVQRTLSPELKAKTDKLKEDIQAWKTKVDARIATVRSKAASRHQQLLTKSASNRITVPDDYPTIQAAVDAAAPGSKIVVKNGDYAEIVYIGTDDLTIIAERKGKARVTGGFEFDGVSKGAVQGFDVTGSIVVGGCSEVVVKDNEVKDDFGILLFESVDCEVKNNRSTGSSGGVIAPAGIGVVSGGKHEIKNNTLRSNFVGILILGGLTGEETAGENEIVGNICTENLYGLVLLWSNDNELKNNRCNENLSLGIYLLGSDGNELGPDNKANKNEDVGIVLEDSDNNDVRRNQAKNNVYCDAIDDGVGNTYANNKFGSFNCP